MDISNKLKRLRFDKNLTQLEIANILNIKQSSYSSYEIGRRIPDIDILIKIADYYKVSLDFLFGREKDYKLPQIKKDLEFKSKSHEKLFAKINELDQDELLMIEGYVNKLIESKELKKLLEMKG